MYRRIQTIFPGRCAKCREAIHKGDMIWYEKGNRAVFHDRCYGKTPEPEKVTVTTDGESSKQAGKSFTIDVAALKRAVMDGLQGKNVFKCAGNWKSAQQYTLKGGSWAGYTPAQLKEWVSGGYKSEVFNDLSEVSPPLRQKRRMIYSDEGEMQIDLVMSGFDNPFIQWTRKPTAPGMSIDIKLSMAASTNVEVVKAYEKWVARMLYTLETEGIDLDVNVVCTVDCLFEGDGYDRNGKHRFTTRINVKREGEASDFTRWSVMVSPGGFRGMVFYAEVMAADSLGKTIDSSYGYPVDGEWDLIFNPETRKLIIDTPKSPSSFPAEQMTEKLRTILATFK